MVGRRGCCRLLQTVTDQDKCSSKRRMSGEEGGKARHIVALSSLSGARMYEADAG